MTNPIILNNDQVSDLLNIPDCIGVIEDPF